MLDPIEYEVDRHLKRQEDAQRRYDAIERQVLATAPMSFELDLFLTHFPEHLLRALCVAIGAKNDAETGRLFREALTTDRIDRRMEEGE